MFVVISAGKGISTAGMLDAERIAFQIKRPGSF
jgi:hypothetical protein